MVQIIDGKAVAERLRSKIADQVILLKESRGIVPGLAVILVGENPASQVYVRNKAKACAEVGICSFEHRLPVTTTESDLLDLIAKLNKDKKVHGILVQLPLPASINSEVIIHAINPAKDVDGFHPENAGRLMVGEDCFVPCTPQGSLLLIKEVRQNLKGLRALVVGRSAIVGKPMAHLLLAENCTVTIAHSGTENLAEECLRADILVAAIGKPRFIQGDWVKQGAIIIDVGINRIQKPDGSAQLVGDVDFEKALDRASAITPVPGGVGPMTVACLLRNTLQAAQI